MDNTKDVKTQDQLILGAAKSGVSILFQMWLTGLRGF